MCDAGARVLEHPSSHHGTSHPSAASIAEPAPGAASTASAGASPYSLAGASLSSFTAASIAAAGLPPPAAAASSSHPASLMDDHLHQYYHHLPNLFHSLSHHGASVLAIAVDEAAHTAYSASQSECIVVWDLLTLQERTRLRGHTASVLALELALDKGWLFSSSGDNTVRIWDIHSLQPVAVLYPAEDNVGDIFSLQWSQQLQTLYVGCQNTSIQWISLDSVPASAALPVPSKPHKFFDSVPVALRRRRQREEAHSTYAASSNMGSPGPQSQDTTLTSNLPSSRSNPVAFPSSLGSEPSGMLFSTSFPPGARPSHSPEEENGADEEENIVHLQFSSSCITPFAHFGYVYALLLFYSDDPTASWSYQPQAVGGDESHLKRPFDADNPKHLPILASASGDEHIKLWTCLPDGSIEPRATLQNPESDAGGVLTLAHRPNTLLAGRQAGTIDIWDLETLTAVRTLSAHADDVLSLSSIRVGDEYLCFSAGADGEVRRWDGQFWCTASWKAHDGLALACVPVRLGSGSVRIVSGGSDALIKLWDLPTFGSPAGSSYGAQGASASPTLHTTAHVGSFGGSPYAGGTSNPFLRRTGSSASIPGSSSAFTYGNMRASLLSSARTPTSEAFPQPHEPDVLLSALARFVAFRTVSSDETYREECRQCAHWLKGCLTKLGAETMLVPGANRRNPLVLATFRGKDTDGLSAGGERRRKRCLFYGHYDVVDDDSGHHHHHGHHAQHHQPGPRPSTSGSGSAGGGGTVSRGFSSIATAGLASPGLVGGVVHNRPRGGSGSFPLLHANGKSHRPTTPTKAGLTASGLPPSDPWSLTGRDGYLYGRGASDNKGPILAVACAAAELLAQRELEMDVVLLIEGEEEVGSGGLAEAVRKARAQIGPIDVILLSNSYWLGEETPCITMGLRGVIHASIEIVGQNKDVHSGVEGGALREPMIDMVRLLSTLSDGENVLIPHFYNDVRPVSAEERAAFAAIAKMEGRGRRRLEDEVGSDAEQREGPKQDSAVSPTTPASTESLIARWCRPSLSVHRVGVSGSGNATVIPSKVEAAVSIRIVADMDAARVGRAFEDHVRAQFAALGSNNAVQVRIDHRADWWLGAQGSAYSVALAAAIEAEWGEAPVSIREGGSIPAMALLEKELGAPAVHLPLGQSSDNAHLPGERIRLMNLQRGRAVVRRFFEALPGIA